MTNLEKYSFPTPNDGLLLSTEPNPNGNMLYSTSQYLFLIPLTDISFIIGLESFYRGYGLSRYPTSNDNTSVDDYLAAACLIPNRLLLIEKFGFLDIKFPKVSLSQFMFRFQGFWQHMKISADRFVGPIGRFSWALSIFLAAKQPITNEDSWIQSHLMVLVKERRQFKSWICDQAVKYWRSKKTLPTWQIMASYVGPDCQDHPLIEAWKPYN